MLQIGEDVDYLLIPREVRLAGGVWRVISKPATKEAEFRERLTQFLEEEGRTLEDVARIIEKSTPHPPQPPQKPKEPQVRRRVQQMVTPPPRLVVGTYDSSNASDSEFSDFETTREKGDKGHKGAGRGRKVRKMPVSYLGSKFLGSDLESEDDEELVEAFLRRGEKKPSVPPTRRRVNLPVPMLEDNLGPQPSKADRWREYVSHVSWRKLKWRVKGWTPRSSPGVVDEAQPASTRVESDEVPGNASQGDIDNAGNAGDGCGNAEDGQGDDGDGQVFEAPPKPRRWRPKINWASFRLRRTEEAAARAQRVEAADDQRVEAIADQGAEAAEAAEAADNQRAEPADNQRAESADNQRAEPADNQGAEPADNQEAEPADNQGAESADNQRAESADNQRAEPADNQGAEPADNQEAEPADNQGAGPADNQRAEPADNQGAEPADNQRAENADNQREEAVHSHRAEAPVVQAAEAASDEAEARADQRAEVAHNQRAEAPAVQEAGAIAAPGATGATPIARAQKQVKTVRFQTPGRFSWFRKRRRAFWHTPRLPVLPKRVPRAGEARGLRVLRPEARAEVEQGVQEDLL
ncbi:coiled-coil domain-containing protein 8 [Saccopteryx leptura]|uniref:coiled-coil domain-containing protein 8 n=1 Tax=Saccopteryx leptura TaxID=249018 RepID=UPI00339D0D1C